MDNFTIYEVVTIEGDVTTFEYVCTEAAAFEKHRLLDVRRVESLDAPRPRIVRDEIKPDLLKKRLREW